MLELTDEQKAWIFELVDFVSELADDEDQIMYTSDDIADRMDSIASDGAVKAIVEKLHGMDWSKHREHCVCGAPSHEFDADGNLVSLEA